MRSYDPNDKYDQEEASRLQAEHWMLELLAMNPDYTCWGPYEDYMWKRGRDEEPDELGRVGDSGWEARIISQSWADAPRSLNDLNEVVNFYFEISRDSEECPLCLGDGYSPDAQWIAKSFYSHSSPFKRQTAGERESALVMAHFSGRMPVAVEPGFPSAETLDRYGPEFREFCESMADGDCRWDDKITQDEVEALHAAGRLGNGPCPSADEVNGKRNDPFGHDAINRGILVDARCKRFGIATTCDECGGHGSRYTSPAPHVNLVYWLLHPRKGASRGVEVQKVHRSELPEVFAFLRAAADRNAERFKKIPANREAAETGR